MSDDYALDTTTSDNDASSDDDTSSENSQPYELEQVEGGNPVDQAASDTVETGPATVGKLRDVLTALPLASIRLLYPRKKELGDIGQAVRNIGCQTTPLGQEVWLEELSAREAIEDYGIPRCPPFTQE
jgi:hypothetical protein